MDLSLAGKVVVVAGGSRGIGRACAESFAAEGARVVVAARGAEALSTTVSGLHARGAEAEACVVDLESEGGAARLVDAAVARFGGIDVLVNVSGGSSGGTFAENTIADWESGFSRNFWPAVRTSRAALPHLRTSRGAIIHVSSIWGREAGGLSSYNAAKAALISLTKSMGRELLPEGVRVAGVAPGSVLHPGGSWERRMRENPEKIADFVRRELPANRFGTAAEIADVVCFLASPRASWVNGTTVVVDGGQSRGF